MIIPGPVFSGVPCPLTRETSENHLDLFAAESLFFHVDDQVHHLPVIVWDHLFKFRQILGKRQL